MWCHDERRFARHVCLRNPCLLWNLSLHCLPEAWGPWEPQSSAPPILHYACIPSLQLQKKNESHAEKQRVWSQSCGLQDLLRTIQWLCPRFGLQGTVLIVLSVVTCDCCKPMNNCRDWQDWDFSIRGLEVGLPAFQLPMFSKCDALPKGDLFDMFV